MKQKAFLSDSRIKLNITSEDIHPEVITDELNIIPDVSFRKGETYIGKHSRRTFIRHINMWAIVSKTTISESQDISHHIEYFRSILKNKEDILRRYKKDPAYDVSFWIRILTDDAGVSFELSKSEMSYLSDITNRVHFSITANTEIQSS